MSYYHDFKLIDTDPPKVSLYRKIKQERVNSIELSLYASQFEN